MTTFRFQSHSLEETQRVGQQFGLVIRTFLSNCSVAEDATVTLALSGEMGSGKTTFTQGVAIGLGVSEQVTSPTFTLVNEYKVAIQDGVADGVENPIQTSGVELNLIHMDSYRLVSNSPSMVGGVADETLDAAQLNDVQLDAATFGMVEIFDMPRSLIIIEWANRLTSILPADHLAIDFQYSDSDSDHEGSVDHRMLQFSATGPQSAAILTRVEQLRV